MVAAWWRPNREPADTMMTLEARSLPIMPGRPLPRPITAPGAGSRGTRGMRGPQGARPSTVQGTRSGAALRPSSRQLGSRPSTSQGLGATEPGVRWLQSGLLGGVGALPLGGPPTRLAGPQPFAHDTPGSPARAESMRKGLVRSRSAVQVVRAGRAADPSVRLERVLGRPATSWATSSLRPVHGVGHHGRAADATPNAPAAHMWAMPAAAGRGGPGLGMQATPASTHQRALLALSRASGNRPASAEVER